MVFYRKYRPQKISELDITVVRDKLTSILNSGNIPHAFLFAGPKGLGKTSSARILAKAINCENRSKIKDQRSKTKVQKTEDTKDQRLTTKDDIEPCNECDACISITNGSNLDVIEIDAASNRGIEEIRDLREKIKFSPVSLAKKIYIIDEVHMLTIEAFNALLKTLEEPPGHAVFILCTTEPWKLPETIISRVFYVQFEKPDFDELTRSVTRVLDGEKIKLEKELFRQIFLLSEGSFRDATKIIEELSVMSDDRIITKELFESAYKTNSIDGKASKLLGHLSEKDAKEALLVIRDLAESGADFKIVTEKIVGVLRKLLLKKSGIILDDAEGDNISDIQNLDTASINLLISEFSIAFKEIKFAVLPQLPLELVVVKWCVLEESQKSKVKSQNLVEKNSEENKRDIKKDAFERNIEETKTAYGKQGAGQDDFVKQLIERVKLDNHSIAGVLRGCRLVGIDDGTLRFETAYKFHKDKLSESKTKRIIEKRAGEILGKEISLEVAMKAK